MTSGCPRDRVLFASTDHPELQAALLERASAVEGELEALIVRVTAERKLSRREYAILGCFRQSFQSLRKSIAAGETLRSQAFRPGTRTLQSHLWTRSESPPYIAFKALASHVADLLSAGPRSAKRPDRSYEALRMITDNRWETEWISQAYELLGLDRGASGR